MTVKISRNLHQRMKLLKGEINLLMNMKANKTLNRVDSKQFVEVYQQLKECKRLLKEELNKAPIERLLWKFIYTFRNIL